MSRLRLVSTTLAVAGAIGFWAAMPSASGAQTTPVTAAPPETQSIAAPDAQATLAPVLAPRRAPAKFYHWEITPVIQETWSTGSDIIPKGQGVKAIGTPAGNTLPLDITRLIGVARYRFNNHVGLRFQRIAHTGATGRVKPRPGGGGTFGGHSEDYEERFLMDWTFNPDIVTSTGYAIRTRQCCPAAGAFGNLNPRIHTGFFTETSYRFGPNTIGGKPFTTSLRYELDKHNPPHPATGDEGTKPTWNYTLYGNMYFYHQAKLVPYVGIEYFSTIFSYSAAMTETYRKVYGMAYRATPDLNYRLYVKNDQSGGSLASSGDSAHKSSLFLEAGYRFQR